jgi:hypothetical protein
MVMRLREALAKTPGWESLTVYGRTKRCCEELTLAGEAIPSWTVIRKIIDKGGAKEINRGKNDFHREHGEALRKMQGFVEGVPPALAPLIQGLWTAAIAEVTSKFDNDVSLREAQHDQAEDERDEAVARADLLSTENDGLKALTAELRDQVRMAEQENTLLRARLGLAETRADHLSADNARLSEMLKTIKMDRASSMRMHGKSRFVDKSTEPPNHTPDEI